MESLIFWLPIIAGILLGGIAGNAWYAGDKILSLWLAFAGLICLLLVATIQIHQYLSKTENSKPISETEALVNATNKATDFAQRPWVQVKSFSVDFLKIENENTNIGVTLFLENVGKSPATGIELFTEFHVMTNAVFQELSQKQKAVCERSGHTHPERKNGMSLFPNEIAPLQFSQPVPSREVFQTGPGFEHGVSFILYGCIDYLYSPSESHGQTGIVYFISRNGPNGLSYLIIPKLGIIGATDLIVSKGIVGNYAK